MAAPKKTIARLLTMYQRQPSNRFGAEYQPAQLATTREAPSVSRATILCAEKVGGREIHLMSQPEFAAALVALYHPGVFDLQEQRLLSPGPCEHPLEGHPRSVGRRLPSLPGTVAVLDDMGLAEVHPSIVDRRNRDPSTWRRVPWPYVGDLLLFAEDLDGPYCINWTVKGDVRSFSTRGGMGIKPSRRDEDDIGVLRRHEVERKHYAAAGIRTVQIVGSQFDPEVIANLRVLFMHHARSIVMPMRRRQEVIAAINAFIGRDVVLAGVLDEVGRDFGLDAFTARVVLFQAVWNRQLRLDLFQPIVADHPLVAEQEDVCSRYADLFMRAAP
jgi:hypothetical protein